MDQYYIPTDRERQNFFSHINIDENKRILFSGPFGSGKTTFLHEFFKEHEEYTPVFLRPINYSIASTKDIFEYIKVDVLFELLKIVTLDNTQYSNKELIPEFIAKELYPFICRFIKEIPSIGKSFKLISEALEVSIKKYNKFKKSRNETEFSVSHEFLASQLNEEGNLFEENNITCAIRNIIQKHKEECKKQIVLIIDDLDRIDPGHIFRILNVFACNADSSLYGEELNNKFGFYKVMVVCDINNLRHLFAHQYGTSTDFCGYIDKFYSINVYNFNLKGDVVKFLPKLITNYHEGTQIHVVKYIISDLIYNEMVNLRSLHNLKSMRLNQCGYYHERKYVYPTDTSYVLYQYLKTIYVTEDKINEVISIMKSHLFNHKLIDKPLCRIVGILCSEIYYYQNGRYAEDNFKIDSFGTVYKCTLVPHDPTAMPFLDSVNDVKVDNIVDFNFYPLVEQALIQCKYIINHGKM